MSQGHSNTTAGPKCGQNPPMSNVPPFMPDGSGVEIRVNISSWRRAESTEKEAITALIKVPLAHSVANITAKTRASCDREEKCR
jgi:hypothetical protein